MEMNLLKGISLRTKLIGATIAMSIVLTIGGALGLYKLNQIMSYSENAYTHMVKEDPGDEKEYHEDLMVARQANTVIQAITLGGGLSSILLCAGIAFFFICPVSPLLHRLG